MKKVLIIPKDDLVYYPPTITLIKTLLRCDVEVHYAGSYSDPDSKKQLENEGVVFYSLIEQFGDISRIRVINWLSIIYRDICMRVKIKKFFKKLSLSSNDIIWYIYSSDAPLFHKYIMSYKYVVQFYEFEDPALHSIPLILHPFYDGKKFLKQSSKLIHCEYNRALIINGLIGLEDTPVILPNKPYEDAALFNSSIPDDISQIVYDVKNKIANKIVILYQGIFNSSERRLEEFCEAMSLLPENYIFIAMGGRGDYFEIIRKKYVSDRILFIPFIRPPYHLLITKMANYGVLTYHPTDQSFAGVINPLFCAPNKIFEYGKYGIPMIANELPGLKMLFKDFNCGTIVSSPITPSKIAETIQIMNSNYDRLSQGAKEYYDSVDIDKTIRSIIKL